MNAFSLQRFTVSAVMAAVSLLSVAPAAVAQRDAGAKARGDVRGFWDPGFRASPGPSFRVQPAQPSVESYRTFSYSPVAIAPGDEVTVRGRNAKLMLGQTLVGTLEEGQSFEVTRVKGGWLGAVVEVNGQTLKGWVWQANVAPASVAAVASPRAAAPVPSYRRFSYEPMQPSRSYRDGQGRKEPWQYPKTDRRRYQY